MNEQTRSAETESGEMVVSAALWQSFAALCETLAGTRSKLTKRAVMAEYLQFLDSANAGLAAQYLTGTVFPEMDDRKLQVGSQAIVRALETVVGVEEDRFHTAYRKYGDLGAAAEELLLSEQTASKHWSLTEIAVRLDSMAAARTMLAKSKQLTDVLRGMAPVEAKYFIKLLLGDMRTGVKQSLVEEAIAAATGQELRAVRHAGMLLGNLAAVVALARENALSTARFQMFHPLGFMLATPAANPEEAYARFAGTNDAGGGGIANENEESGPAAQIHAAQIEDKAAQIEDKYDGMRAQIHCGDPEQPGRVRIFSRTREDVTASFPEVAEWFAAVKTRAILDGELLAWDAKADRALPFTALQPRLGRKRVTDSMCADTPVLYLAFDLLLEGNNLLLHVPLRKRRSQLETWVAAALQSVDSTALRMQHSRQASLFETEPGTETNVSLARLRLAPATAMISARQIDEAFDAAQARGNEGLMLKSMTSIYQPGRRGSAWMKLKRELATLDVVVTAVEYGHGRRAGVLSDYTFAVRENSGLRNVGKAYSGLTDEEILKLTPWFLEHRVEPGTVGSRHAGPSRGQIFVEPKIVLEVAFNNVMQSDRHDSGYSLRFPRILRLRPDKPVEEIDTVARVARIFQSQTRSE